jgi:GNAT superfamily N-acetyltransferase
MGDGYKGYKVMNRAHKLLHYLKQHQSFSDEEYQERLKNLEHDSNVVPILNTNHEIVGVLEVKRYDSFVHGQSAHLTVACDDNEDALKLAEQILKEQLIQLKAEGVRMVMMGANVQLHTIHKLIQNQQFNPWYGYVFMRHEGAIPQPNKLSKRIIALEDYESYIQIMSVCFTEMRQAMNIKPYAIIEMLWRDEEHKIKNQDEWWKHRDQTWMYYDEQLWVGSGLLYKEDIDDVFVPGSLQGRSYGRMIVEDLIREAYARNIKPYIGYVKWNAKAGHLYQKLGFIPYLEVQYYQKML